jgi:hypothetical protein
MKFLRVLSGFASTLLFELCIRPLEAILLSMIDFDHSGFRKMLKNTLAWLKDLAWLLLTRFRAGVLRWDGPEWSVIFIHDGCTHSREELLYLLFPDPPTESDLGWLFLWQVPSTIRKRVEQGCLVICDLNHLLHWGTQFRYTFRVSPWLRANLNVSGPLDMILNRITKNRRRWILKLPSSGYSYEFSHRPEDFGTFYHKMYVPYVIKRHRKRAIVEPIETKQAMFEKGGLVLVKYQGQPVAAGLRHVVGDTLIAGSYAIHEDHTHLIKQGVAVALHWYTIDWARCNNLHSIDFGMTRSRLEDGVFEYKRQWGARFERDILTHTMWTFVGENLPPKLIHHLNNLTFIAQVGREYRCVVFVNDDETDLSNEELLQRKKRVSTRANLSGLLILPLGDNESPPAG